jgi:hypothetical protein
MNLKEKTRGLLVILLATLVLALSISFKNNSLILATAISLFIIISINIITKKIVGYNFETKVKTKFWSLYQFGFRKDSHFKTPIPMIWFPLVLSLFTKGLFWWLAVLEFDVEAKPERASRRHGLYRFTEVTEWHMCWIALWGIIANIFFALIGYVAGFELFAKLSIYYAIWSIIPLSSLDGSKIFFGSRYLWAAVTIILLLFFGWGLAI